MLYFVLIPHKATNGAPNWLFELPFVAFCGEAPYLAATYRVAGPQAESVTLLSTVELLILRRPPSLTSPYAVRSRTTRPSLK